MCVLLLRNHRTIVGHRQRGPGERQLVMRTTLLVAMSSSGRTRGAHQPAPSGVGEQRKGQLGEQETRVLPEKRGAHISQHWRVLASSAGEGAQERRVRSGTPLGSKQHIDQHSKRGSRGRVRRRRGEREEKARGQRDPVYRLPNRGPKRVKLE